MIQRDMGRQFTDTEQDEVEEEEEVIEDGLGKENHWPMIQSIG